MMKPNILICARETDPTARRMPGSVRRGCHRCGAVVWVAPSSWQMERGKRRPLRIVCVDCAGELARLAGRPLRVQPPTRGQLAEMWKFLRGRG